MKLILIQLAVQLMVKIALKKESNLDCNQYNDILFFHLILFTKTIFIYINNRLSKPLNVINIGQTKI